MAVVWATGTSIQEGTDSVIALTYGASWASGTTIDSPNGDFRLDFQVDGNLVLLQLPATILWESETAGMGATLLWMQTDGNLVIYDGVIPLWASGTLVFGSYLQLQDDGNLVIYSYGGIESLGVFTLLPNWQEGMLETLEWMTSVTESPLAVEQRMGLRLSPRKSLEMGHMRKGPLRSFFDLFMMAGGGSPIYLPLFHDVGKIDAALTIGDNVISVDTTYSEFIDCRHAVLIASPFVFEVVEVWSHTDTTLTLVAGVASDWPAGTKIYPVMKVKVETQPRGDRYADRVYKSRTRFISLEANDSSATAIFGEYLDQLVLEEEPNDASQLSYEYGRKTFNIDAEVGLQQISDVAPFVNETYAWFAKGRQASRRLRGIFYTLQGRRRPIWIPSYFADFDLAANMGAADTVMNVKRCGYSDTGGPFANREHILIHMRDGTRLYRKITAAAIVGAEGLTENLSLDAAPGVDLTPANVLRISFLAFSRLDQDSIEFTHHTDNKGLTTANSVFRTDPGIEGIGPSYANIEIDPLTPPVIPPPHPVYDPAMPPDGKLWMYKCGFGTFAGSDWIRIHWDSRRSEGELLADNPGLAPGLDDAFPPYNISGDGSQITLPDTGSFTVRSGIIFLEESGSASVVYNRMVIDNLNYDAPTTGMLGPSPPMVRMQTEIRKSIYYSKIDVNQPLVVGIDFKFEGSGNLYPACNLALDCEPYHGNATSGDSFLIIEWWRT